MAQRPLPDERSAAFGTGEPPPPPDLTDLSSMLGLISKYWGRPSAGVIECYVAKDLANWPDDSMLPRQSR